MLTSGPLQAVLSFSARLILPKSVFRASFPRANPSFSHCILESSSVMVSLLELLQSQPGAVLFPRRHSAMSADIFGCHNWGWHWHLVGKGTKNAAIPSTTHRQPPPPTKGYLGCSVDCAESETWGQHPCSPSLPLLPQLACQDSSEERPLSSREGLWEGDNSSDSAHEELAVLLTRRCSSCSSCSALRLASRAVRPMWQPLDPRGYEIILKWSTL